MSADATSAGAHTHDERGLLAAARAGDEGAFERLVTPHRRELHAHCYRMLGSLQDAEDALQETLLAAWRGLGGFEGRSSLRTWLYRIATRASLRLAERRPPRALTSDAGPAWSDIHELGEFRERDARWIEPYPTGPGSPADGSDGDPAERVLRHENVELAFVAALQRLPANQRAALILREVLDLPAADVAAALDTSVASINSALQRARKTVGDRLVAGEQAAELQRLGGRRQRELVGSFVAAWNRADVGALLALLDDEKELTRRSDELARRRQDLPWVRIDATYRFDTDAGPASLADLFDGRSQLIVYHFMFPPSWEAGCPSCSSLADGFDGIDVHLRNHDVAFTAVSRAPLPKLQAYKRRMGWSFPWASSAGSDFNADFGVSFTADQMAQGRATDNFRTVEGPPDAAGAGDGTGLVDDAESPGMSAFAMQDGEVFHTYSTYARGVDALWGMYQWLDRAPLGRNEPEGMWFRRHDEYPA